MKLHKWKNVRKELFTEEERAAMKAGALAELALEMNLPELRNALGKTQLDVAEAAEMTQSSLSDFERRDDHVLSVLRRYIQALGGDLEVNAVFGDTRVKLKGI